MHILQLKHFEWYCWSSSECTDCRLHYSSFWNLNSTKYYVFDPYQFVFNQSKGVGLDFDIRHTCMRYGSTCWSRVDWNKNSQSLTPNTASCWMPRYMIELYNRILSYKVWQHSNVINYMHTAQLYFMSQL